VPDPDPPVVAVSQTIFIARGVPVVQWPKPANIHYGTTLGAHQLNASSRVAGSFRYTPGAGTILPVGANQRLNVAFSPTDIANYGSASASSTITVLQAAPHITLMALPSRTYGDPPFRLSVKGNVAGTTTKYAVKGACRISGVVITLTSAGARTVTATQPGNRDYLSASSGPVNFLIARAKPLTSWARPGSIKVGTPLGESQLNAKATFHGQSLKGRFVYNPPAGTRLRVGIWTLHATFVPADGRNFGTVTISTAITVRN
jgi:hypothetical protein